VDRSRASIRSIGRGRRTIEVTYHQNGTARRMSNGKAKVVTRRRFVEGLIAAVISAGVLRSPAGRVTALVTDVSGPLILEDVVAWYEAATSKKSVTPSCF
jgi:hypothetical protein